MVKKKFEKKFSRVSKNGCIKSKKVNSIGDKTGELRNGAKNVNTGKTTSFWLSVWKTWCEGKSIALDLKGHEPAELNSTNSTPK